MNHIVKRGNHTEPYDQKKLYASIYAVCLSVREHPGAAELIAQEVTEKFEQWQAKKHEVTSNDIRRVSANFLKDINPDAGHIYTHHRVIW